MDNFEVGDLVTTDYNDMFFGEYGVVLKSSSNYTVTVLSLKNNLSFTTHASNLILGYSEDPICRLLYE
jgi:hypothetical protein